MGQALVGRGYALGKQGFIGRFELLLTGLGADLLRFLPAHAPLLSQKRAHDVVAYVCLLSEPPMSSGYPLGEQTVIGVL